MTPSLPPLPTPSRPALRPAWPQILAIALAVLFVFGQSCLFEFVNWDDDQLIAKNPYVNPPSVHKSLAAWSKPHSHMYIPLTYNLWSLLASVGQSETPDADGITINPWLFHTANVTVHLLNALLVFQILQLLLKRPWLATFGAIIFAVHPLQVEPVAWATGMKDLLSSFFALLAILLHLHAADGDRHGKPTRQTWATYLAAMLCLFLATLAKPGVIGVPVIAIVLDWLILGRPLRRSLLCALLLLAAVIPAVIWTQFAQPDYGIQPISPWARPLIATHALTAYLQKIVWPNTFTFDYGLTPTIVLQGHWVYFAWLIPAAISIGILLYPLHRRTLGAAWLVLLAGVGPVLGLMPFLFQYYSTVADRYMYLSMLGVALAAAWALSRLRPAPAIGIAVLLCLSLAIRSIIQVATWENSTTLARHAIEINPRSFAAHANLAAIRAKEALRIRAITSHENPSDPRIVQARQQANTLMDQAQNGFLASLRYNPNHVLSLSNLANLYTERGEYDAALQYLERAVDAMDTLPDVFTQGAIDRLTVGKICLNMRQYPRAADHFRRFLKRYPDNAEARALLLQATAKSATQPAQ